jgi:hypothetical protein
MVTACEAISIRPRINAKGINDFNNIETDASEDIEENAKMPTFSPPSPFKRIRVV